MKQKCFFNALILLIFLSCNKSEEHLPIEQEMIIGHWRFTKVLLVDGHNSDLGTAVLSSEEVDPCSGETEWIFKTDGSFSLDTFKKSSDTTTSCQLVRSRKGNFTYDMSTREIILNYDKGNKETFRVYLARDTELWINLGAIDTGNDDELIYHMLGLNKK